MFRETQAIELYPFSARSAWRFPFVSALLLVAICLAAVADARATQITAARVWPSQDYTRVALEIQEPVKYEVLSLKDPERLVLDLEGVEITAALTELADKIQPNDP